MAGSVILLDSVTASSSATVTLGTTDWDSSYNVYMVVLSDVTPATDNQPLYMKLNKASDNSTDDTSNYDYVQMTIKTYNAFEKNERVDGGRFKLTDQEIGTGTGETANGIIYLYNFNNASEYSSITMEMTNLDDSAHLHGNHGLSLIHI